MKSLEYGQFCTLWSEPLTTYKDQLTDAVFYATEQLGKKAHVSRLHNLNQTIIIEAEGKGSIYIEEYCEVTPEGRKLFKIRTQYNL